MSVTPEPDQLASSWADILSAEPHTWIRDAAARIGVSEVQLLATRCGDGVERLRLDLDATFPRLAELGRLMGLTRNDGFVVERHGVYESAFRERAGAEGAVRVTGPGIDLLVFPNAWHHAFAQTDTGAHGERLSLHFFDVHGEAVHKIYSTPGTDQAAFRSLVANLRHEDQGRRQAIHAEPAAREAGPQGPLHLARTVPVPLASLRTVLEEAARQGIPLTVSVRNSGAVQSHHGTVHDVREAQGWFNVLDPEFNLHVLESAIAAASVVYPGPSVPEPRGPRLAFTDGTGRRMAHITVAPDASASDAAAWEGTLAMLEEGAGA